MLSFPVKVDVRDSYSLKVTDKMRLYYVKHYSAISSLSESDPHMSVLYSGEG